MAALAGIAFVHAVHAADPQPEALLNSANRGYVNPGLFFDCHTAIMALQRDLKVTVAPLGPGASLPQTRQTEAAAVRGATWEYEIAVRLSPKLAANEDQRLRGIAEQLLKESGAP